VRDLSAHIEDIGPEALTPDVLAQLAALDPARLPRVQPGVRLGPPVARVGKIVCTGPNYPDLPAESGTPIPSEPRLYMKATTSISGPHDDPVLPGWATTAHWENELAVVIGTIARAVPEAASLAHVAGYCILNDIADRAAATAGGGESVKGRSADGFGPMGPWLVTREAFSDQPDLALWTEIDGRRFQESRTGAMVFPVRFLVSYISRYMTLQPGDVISTGTPASIGLRPPPTYLRPGTHIHLGIEGLGEQRYRVIAPSI
jgi:2-keto-4-pentenoate hydratase/2-oxohepta-3-ene-1,7-dioic acid hydratase in catechol pathway